MHVVLTLLLEYSCKFILHELILSEIELGVSFFFEKDISVMDLPWIFLVGELKIIRAFIL